MVTTNLNIRIEKEVKEAAEVIFDELGITMTAAITMFLKKTIRDNGIPFDVTLNKPNKVTLEALAEAKALLNDPKAPTYKSVEELFEFLNS